MKYKKYRKVKDALIASAGSGMVAGMLFIGGNTALAESRELQTPSYSRTVSGMHLMHKWSSPGNASSLGGYLGLTKEEIKQELKSGKTMKQIMQEHGLTPNDLGSVFGKRNS